MNILIAGIPYPDLLSYIHQRYGEDVKLFVAESRPFEVYVGRGVAEARDAGFSVTLCTDNAIGSLMKEQQIDVVWSLYSRKEQGTYKAINGALMSAILAKECGISFMLFSHFTFPSVDDGSFNGVSVSVEGVTYIEHELDTVGTELVSEVV